MQTITVANILAVFSVATGLIATGYVTRSVKPNGIVLVQGTSIMVVKVST